MEMETEYPLGYANSGGYSISWHRPRPAPVRWSLAGHRQVISRISKGSHISWCMILLLPLLTVRVAARAEVFLPWHLPWQELAWRCTLYIIGRQTWVVSTIDSYCSLASVCIEQLDPLHLEPTLPQVQMPSHRGLDRIYNWMAYRDCSQRAGNTHVYVVNWRKFFWRHCVLDLQEPNVGLIIYM